ncbi:hypothetical protein ESCO_001427 [Escovopsis weberi]|uniref:Uncharacterized protein n=1 Tax=Escovopsis weberi TaxID=150374 RepID=A0A0M8N7S7_ESCWE|nr:hypothetical protein ESCO_001427 [Escovopsis weberi]
MDHDSHNVSELRHFPNRQAVVKRRRTTNHIVRSTAKRVAEWGNDAKQGERAKIARFDPSKKISRPRGPAADHAAAAAASSDATRRRARLEKDIRSIIHFRGSGSSQQRERREFQRETLLTADETLEGRELASSDVPLPSDRFRLANRTPSLERQEAFRVDSTAKSKVRVCHVGPSVVSDDEQIAALYEMGLLYDNDRDYQQPVFDLNSIKHEEPVYTVRLAKRGRRGGKKAAAGGQEGVPVQLEFSFTSLGNHSAIAQYIKSPLGQSSSGRGRGGKGAQRSARQSAPLRVVYGANGRNPSLEAETSQADLMSDSFSDYEYLCDSEMDDDLPSQREIQEPSNNLRCDTWIILG